MVNSVGGTLLGERRGAGHSMIMRTLAGVTARSYPRDLR